MKSIFNKYIMYFMLVLTVFSTVSCESFLDRQEDEQLTFEKIWHTLENTRKYWYTAMSYTPHEMSTINGDSNPFLGASDEATVAYSRDYNKIIYGSWNPSNIPYGDPSTRLYQGIRECTVFMENVFTCGDYDSSASEEILGQMQIQARFARAYNYFHLMRLYGPVYLLGDEVLDFRLTTEELMRPRNTWDQCVDYVVSEMQICRDSKYMKATWESDMEKGLATKGACQAVISRLLLYSARDLFNGNDLYKNLVNPETPDFPEQSGERLFPDYKADKWKQAADASRKLIDDYATQYKLYRKGNDNPYEDYYGITQENWNDEIIYSASGYKGRYNYAVTMTPTALAGTSYGAAGPTQQQVDAYAMGNGRYPITGYEVDGSPKIDSRSGYPANEFEMKTWTYPSWGGNINSYSTVSPAMYEGREPRFYVNVFFSGQMWKHGDGETKISFAQGGNSNTTHDHPKSGYLISRFYDHTVNSAAGQWGNMTFPTFRLAEIYLNYIEAVLECKKRGVAIPSDYESKAMEVWADIRDRAGLKPITEVYPTARDNYELLIEYCRKERRVELSFENHRFFDTRTWMIATETDNGYMYGMNVNAKGSGTNTPDEFWKRVTFDQPRVFRNNYYLYPFSQRELDRNKLLVQNYGW
ncbi:RagB/SusD family nutrient uptake outer membrane protein [Paludibacter sp. 221]|uniref:RagB/SusD family nutrient uptake outer membrane protein n=1 Tax=Paludibacter sp. 221 TaxID=2302939 RepID=UPI001941AD9B|nr:RagB/SusD family nutrient uptake outer membrane protein [Paludibacter sp. 221]